MKRTPKKPSRGAIVRAAHRAKRAGNHVKAGELFASVGVAYDAAAEQVVAFERERRIFDSIEEAEQFLARSERRIAMVRDEIAKMRRMHQEAN